MEPVRGPNSSKTSIKIKKVFIERERVRVRMQRRKRLTTQEEPYAPNGVYPLL